MITISSNMAPIEPYLSVPDKLPYTQVSGHLPHTLYPLTMWLVRRSPLDPPQYTTAHHQPRQLFQHYPLLRPLYSSIEADFHAQRYVNFAYATWPALPLALCAGYGVMIVLGRRFMAGRAPYDWRGALAWWNLALSLFSFCGMLRTVPHLIHNITTMPFKVGR